MDDEEFSREEIARRFAEQVARGKLFEAVRMLGHLLEEVEKFGPFDIYDISKLIKYYEDEQERYNLDEDLLEELNRLYEEFVYPLISNMKEVKSDSRYPIDKERVKQIKELLKKMALELARQPQILELIGKDEE